ncbi:5428_t:CDS:2 [Funneliformis geosporum]|uniref:5428_t:CDS:1 n=1 Tax=Funneliformis geosporum TaxID=1117311 RepID=A0A9W4T5I8_9GLOM|nr:5428_t:CDS:2 [Funneliformis geosporum]
MLSRDPKLKDLLEESKATSGELMEEGVGNVIGEFASHSSSGVSNFLNSASECYEQFGNAEDTVQVDEKEENIGSSIEKSARTYPFLPYVPPRLIKTWFRGYFISAKRGT